MCLISSLSVNSHLAAEIIIYTDQFSLLEFLMIESWFTSGEFIHDACVLMMDLKGDSDNLCYFLVIDNNDIKILQKSSLLLLLHLLWIQNCRQQKIYNRLCMKSILCMFSNKAMRQRQTMGFSCCLQYICRSFEAMDKTNQTVNGIWHTNGLEGAYISCWQLLLLFYKCDG